MNDPIPTVTVPYRSPATRARARGLRALLISLAITALTLGVPALASAIQTGAIVLPGWLAPTAIVLIPMLTAMAEATVKYLRAEGEEASDSTAPG